MITDAETTTLMEQLSRLDSLGKQMEQLRSFGVGGRWIAMCLDLGTLIFYFAAIIFAMVTITHLFCFPKKTAFFFCRYSQ